MKTRSLHFLFAFLSFSVAVGLACSSLTSTPTSVPEPTIVPATQASSNSVSATNTTDATETTSSALVTFTDKNSLYRDRLAGRLDSYDGQRGALLH